MRTSAILVLIACLSACGSPDQFSRPSLELKSRLHDYSRSGDAQSVIEWATQYHGEAPGHQMRIDFVAWGNANQKKMRSLLKRWPSEDYERITDLLRWAATDSGQSIKFDIPPKSPNHRLQLTGDARDGE